MDRRDQYVQTRVTEDEASAVDALVVKHGFKNRSALNRALLRVAAEMLEVDPQIVRAWKDLAKSNVQIGNNLNQMARRANRGELIWSEEDYKMVALAQDNAREVNQFLADYLRDQRMNSAERLSILACEAQS